MINLANIPNYTDANMVTLLRYGIAQLAISEEVTVAGRHVRRADLPKLMDTLKIFEARVAATGDASGGQFALASLGNPAIGTAQDPNNPGV
jgi:hypothetical protein